MDSGLDCVENGGQKEGMEESRMKGESNDFRCTLLQVFQQQGNIPPVVCRIGALGRG